jgi:hypothetical protein
MRQIVSDMREIAARHPEESEAISGIIDRLRTAEETASEIAAERDEIRELCANGQYLTDEESAALAAAVAAGLHPAVKTVIERLRARLTMKQSM